IIRNVTGTEFRDDPETAFTMKLKVPAGVGSWPDLALALLAPTPPQEQSRTQTSSKAPSKTRIRCLRLPVSTKPTRPNPGIDSAYTSPGAKLAACVCEVVMVSPAARPGSTEAGEKTQLVPTGS